MVNGTKERIDTQSIKQILALPSNNVCQSTVLTPACLQVPINQRSHLHVVSFTKTMIHLFVLPNPPRVSRTGIRSSVSGAEVLYKTKSKAWQIKSNRDSSCVSYCMPTVGRKNWNRICHWTILCISNIIYTDGRSRWPRDLRRGSGAARFLGLRVRISPRTRRSASCKCCVFSSRDLYVGLITRPEESYRVWGVAVWSWNLDNEEAMANCRLLRHEQEYI
jgi:hypothetical protein